MTDNLPPRRLDELDARIKRLKGELTDGNPADNKAEAKGGYGLAFALATDMVGGLVGGGLLGWGIDTWLNTAPWGLIGCFFLGALAGMWNVYRTVRGHDAAMGFRSPAGTSQTGRRSPGPSSGSGNGEEER